MMDGCVDRYLSVQFRGDLSAQPIFINFHKLSQIRDPPAILTMINNKDVFRAVVSLLHMYLPDVLLRDIHETVQSPGVNTIILTRNHADVLEDYRRRRCSDEGATLSPMPSKKTKGDDFTHMLAEIYSDSEETQEEMEEWETSYRCSWEQFLKDLPEFVNEACERKEKRKLLQADGKIPPSAIGAESLIVAAACYTIKRLTSGETVLQLYLLAVGRHYRCIGIGSHIMELLKTHTVVGPYDALVVHSAVYSRDFFKRHGLSDDVVLNDTFKELNNDWPNSVLLTYFPPFTTDLEMRNPNFSLSVSELEADLNMLKFHALSAHQQQEICVTRLLREVETLQRQLAKEREKVEHLTMKLQQEKQKWQNAEQKHMLYRTLKESLHATASDSDDQTEQEHLKLEKEETAQSEETFIQTMEGAEGCE